MTQAQKGRRGRGESKHSPRRLNAAEKQRQALQLRVQGNSYDEIARALKYSDRSAAYNAVEAGRKSLLREPAEEFVDMQLERLYGLLKKWYPLATGDPPDEKACALSLKILEQIADYEGWTPEWQKKNGRLNVVENNGPDYAERIAAIVAGFRRIEAIGNTTPPGNAASGAPGEIIDGNLAAREGASGETQVADLDAVPGRPDDGIPEPGG